MQWAARLWVPGLDLEATDFLRPGTAYVLSRSVSLRLLVTGSCRYYLNDRVSCKIPARSYSGLPVVPSSFPKLAADGAAVPTMAGVRL